MRRVAVLGGVVGLVVSITILFLLWRFGVWRLMSVGGTDLRAILWPSSIMLTTGWYSTAPGIITTISSVAINCLLYALVALLVRAGVRSIAKSNRS